MSVILFFGIGFFTLLVGFTITGVTLYHWMKKSNTGGDHAAPVEGLMTSN